MSSILLLGRSLVHGRAVALLALGCLSFGGCRRSPERNPARAWVPATILSQDCPPLSGIPADSAQLVVRVRLAYAGPEDTLRPTVVVENRLGVSVAQFTNARAFPLVVMVGSGPIKVIVDQPSYFPSVYRVDLRARCSHELQFLLAPRNQRY
jgi:hypothetical protein